MRRNLRKQHGTCRVMYTLTKPPSKLAAKVRRGPTQQIDKFNSWESEKRVPLGPADMSSPKPTFNGRRNYPKNNSNSYSNNNSMTQEQISPQHEENVCYAATVWSQVQREYDDYKRNGRESVLGGPEYYQDKNPTELKGFEAIDLDSWISDRMLRALTNSPKN